MENSNECKKNFVAVYDGSNAIEDLKVIHTVKKNPVNPVKKKKSTSICILLHILLHCTLYLYLFCLVIQFATVLQTLASMRPHIQNITRK